MLETTGISDSEAINVFIRVRPPILSEVTKEVVTVEGGDCIHLKYDKYNISCKYNRVFDRHADQTAVFRDVKPLLEDALAGINCSGMVFESCCN